jgi:hypothetical protein
MEKRLQQKLEAFPYRVDITTIQITHVELSPRVVGLISVVK